MCTRTYLVKSLLHSDHAFMGQGPIGCAQLDNIRDDIVSVVAGVEASQADHLGVQGISLPSHHSLQKVQARTWAVGICMMTTIADQQGYGKSWSTCPSSGGPKSSTAICLYKEAFHATTKHAP